MAAVAVAAAAVAGNGIATARGPAARGLLSGGTVNRPVDDLASATPGIIAEQRQAMQRAEQERAAARQRALEALASAANEPQVRITTWERLHALTLPRAPEHALVRLIARQTHLTVAEVHDEQRRRAGLLPP